MNGWFDSFDELYDFYDNEEPEFDLDGYRYIIQHYGDDEHPKLMHVTVIDYDNIPKGEFIYDKKYILEEKEYENSFDLIHNFKLRDGKTLAQMTCDKNGWDYSILPVYPKWLDPILGDISQPEEISEEWEEFLRKCDEKDNIAYEKKKQKLLAEGKIDEVREMEEFDKLPYEEKQKIFEQWAREIFIK